MVEDIDRILENGWDDFFANFIAEKLGVYG